MASRKENGVMTTIRKSYRVDENTDRKIKELMREFDLKSENELFKKMVNYIYEIKEKKLVTADELEKKDNEIKSLYYELGKLKTELEKEREKKKFRLFGG